MQDSDLSRLSPMPGVMLEPALSPQRPKLNWQLNLELISLLKSAELLPTRIGVDRRGCVSWDGTRRVFLRAVLELIRLPPSRPKGLQLKPKLKSKLVCPKKLAPVGPGRWRVRSADISWAGRGRAVPPKLKLVESSQLGIYRHVLSLETALKLKLGLVELWHRF